MYCCDFDPRVSRQANVGCSERFAVDLGVNRRFFNVLTQAWREGNKVREMKELAGSDICLVPSLGRIFFTRILLRCVLADYAIAEGLGNELTKWVRSVPSC
jgi:hypothetical protein